MQKPSHGVEPASNANQVTLSYSDHHFSPEAAKLHGVEAAILIKNFQFWIEKNRANKKNFYDGRTWTYNSVSALCELFHYWKKGQIERLLIKLEEQGVIISGNYNKKAYDRTKWYAFKDESIWLKKDTQKQEFHFSKTGNGFTEKGKPIPYNKPDNKIHISIEKSDLEETANINNSSHNNKYTFKGFEFCYFKVCNEKLTIQELEKCSLFDKWITNEFKTGSLPHIQAHESQLSQCQYLKFINEYGKADLYNAILMLNQSYEAEGSYYDFWYVGQEFEENEDMPGIYSLEININYFIKKYFVDNLYKPAYDLYKSRYGEIKPEQFNKYLYGIREYLEIDVNKKWYLKPGSENSICNKVREGIVLFAA